MITHFSNAVVTVSYEPEQRLGMAVWNGFLSSAEFREAVSICIDLMEEHKLLLWLGDNRKLRAIRQADQDWIVEVALPRMIASTLRRNAAVVSEDLFNRMAVEHIVQRADTFGDMVLHDFDTIEEAMAWLHKPFATQEQV